MFWTTYFNISTMTLRPVANVQLDRWGSRKANRLQAGKMLFMMGGWSETRNCQAAAGEDTWPFRWGPVLKNYPELLPYYIIYYRYNIWLEPAWYLHTYILGKRKTVIFYYIIYIRIYLLIYLHWMIYLNDLLNAFILIYRLINRYYRHLLIGPQKTRLRIKF